MSLDKNNGNAVSDCGFYFGTSPTRSRMTKYSFKDYGTYDVSTKETKYMTISNLTQGTEYYYRAYAVNEVGEEYTDAESFTTLDDVLADPVIYFPENQTTGTAGESIAIHWYEVANVDGYRYHIKQLSGEPDNSNNESSINYWTGSTSSKHYTLDGENVKGGYWYKFVVEAYADGYNSSWSDAVYVFIPSLPESTATPRIDPDPTPKPTTIPDNTATPHIGSDPTPGPTLQVDYKLLTLPSSLIIIEEEAFYGNTAIEKVILPGRIKEIRSLAFANSSIKEINLPDSLEYIADNAFSGTNLKKVTANQGTKAYDWAVDHGYINPEPSGFIVKKGNETIIAQGATSGSFACNPSAGLNDVATFTVVTNYDWTVSASNTNWMSVEKTNSSTAVVTIGTVEDGGSYSSVLTFTANGQMYRITITLEKPALPVDFTGTFTTTNKTKTLTLGESWNVEGNVSVTNSTLGRVTIQSDDGPGFSLTEDFKDTGYNSTNLQNWAAYTIDTTKAPFNVARTYTVNLWAKDINGVGGTKVLDTMILNIRENSFDPMWPCESSFTITCLYKYSSGDTHSTRYETGIDIGGGGNIVATEAGTVITATTLTGSFGNYVVIDHGNEIVSLYGHLSSRSVSVGDYVTKGQVIGVMGQTGNAQGIHLHFELANKNTKKGDPWKDYFRNKYVNNLIYHENCYLNNNPKDCKDWIINHCYKNGSYYYPNK